MEPISNQELAGKYTPDDGAPPIPNSPERPSEPLVQRDLRKIGGGSEPEPEFGPIPDLAARKTGEPFAIWSDGEIASDAEAAQATLNPGPTRGLFSYRRMALALIFVGVLGFGIHRMHKNQQRPVAATLRQQADHAQRQGQQDLYLQYLEQYIAQNDQDVDALVEFASAMYGQARTLAESESLLTLLERICGLDPERRDSRRQLIGIAMELGRYKEALSNLELLEKVTPDDGELKLLIGRCYEQEQDFSAAIAAYEASIKCLPEQLDAYERLAGLWIRKSRSDAQLFYMLDQMVIANRQTPAALILRSRFRLNAGMISGSAADIRNARAVDPNLTAAHLMVTRLANVGGVSDAGELQNSYGHLKRTVDSNPGNLGLYQSLALLETKLGTIPSAQVWLQRGLEIQPESYGARLQLILLLVSARKFDEARAQIDLLDSAKEPSESTIHAGKCLSAFVLMQVQDWRQAAKSLEEVLPQLRGEPELQTWTDSWLARCFHETHDSSSEIAVLRRILDRAPTAIPPRRALAHALAERGNLDDAIRHLSMVRDDAEVALELLQLKFRRTLLVDANDRNWDDIDQAIALPENSARSSWPMILLKARIDEVRSGAESAIQYLTETVARTPRELEVQLVLALTALRNRANELARETLETAEQRFGDDVRLDSAWIHFWSWQAADVALPRLAAIEDSLEQRPAPERLRLEVLLARAWVLRGAHEKAEHLWHQLAAQQPENLQLQLLAFESSLNSGHWARATGVLPQIEAIEGTGGPYAAACRVAVLLMRTESGDLSDTGQIRVAFRRLQQVRPNWHVVTALEGRIFQLEREDLRAEETFRLALENGSRDADVLSRLLTLLCRTNRYTEADLAIQQFEPYWDGRCWQLDSSRASEIAERAGNSEHAIALAGSSIQEGSAGSAGPDSPRLPSRSETDNPSSDTTIRDPQEDGSGTDLRGIKMNAVGKVNMFAAEFLFSDFDLKYRLIFEETANSEGTPSRTLGSVPSLFQTLLLTEEQIAFFNAAAMNIDSLEN